MSLPIFPNGSTDMVFRYFFKRDNAKNFNCRSVDMLLENRMVIPLNSPYYFAPYNGSIEHAQGELKSYLVGKKMESLQGLMLQVKMGIHHLNHKIRRKVKPPPAGSRWLKTRSSEDDSTPSIVNSSSRSRFGLLCSSIYSAMTSSVTFPEEAAK